MQAFLDAVHSAKSAFQGKALFAFNLCADAVIHSSPQEIASLPFVKENKRLLIDILSGTQREIKIGKKDLQLLQKKFPHPQLRIGGQAGIAAEMASSLGTECHIISAHPSRRLFSLFSHPKKILVFSGRSFAPLGSLKPTSADFPLHYIFEYAASSGKRSRFIAAYDPISILPKNLPSSIRPFTHLFLGGFHLFNSEKEVREASRMISKWKKQNPNLKIFLELGDFQSKEALSETKKLILPPADCVGFNEEELFALTHSIGTDAIKKLPKKTGKILFHSPRLSFSLPPDSGDDSALTFAKLCSSYRAKYGKSPGFPALEKYAKEATSLYVHRPKFTVGLGDTFSCAYFLASKF